MINKAGNVRIM